MGTVGSTGSMRFVVTWARCPHCGAAEPTGEGAGGTRKLERRCCGLRPGAARDPEVLWDGSAMQVTCWERV